MERTRACSEVRREGGVRVGRVGGMAKGVGLVEIEGRLSGADAGEVAEEEEEEGEETRGAGGCDRRCAESRATTSSCP